MSQGYAAYARTHQVSLNGRSTEAEALLKGAQLLNEASMDRSDLNRLLHALNFNHKLWTVIEADLRSTENPLPSGVRDDLLVLCRFMSREIARATQRPEAAALGAMMAVNRNVANGLL